MVDEPSISDRERLVSNDVVLDATSLRLDQAQRSAAESEQIGVNIYEKLRQQRERLERASRALHETDVNMDQNNQMIQDMIRKAKANKIIATLIIIALSSMILLVLYYKIIK